MGKYLWGKIIHQEQSI